MAGGGAVVPESVPPSAVPPGSVPPSYGESAQGYAPEPQYSPERQYAQTQQGSESQHAPEPEYVEPSPESVVAVSDPVEFARQPTHQPGAAESTANVTATMRPDGVNGSSSTNGFGALSGRLAQLGLTQDQVQGVLALSREVIEQAVWEVVPALAETLIKEEIARLTHE